MDVPRRIRGSWLLLEAVVVIASILVAFALDAWWDRRSQAQAEAAHLRALTSDFTQNVTRLQRLIQREEAIAAASRQLLLLAVAADADVPKDTVPNLLGQVFTSVRFDPVMGAYQAIVGSGGLARISDDSLRVALAEFASLLEGRYYERFSDEMYFDFVRSFTGQLGLFTAAVLSSDAPGKAAVSAGSTDPRELLRDPKFREHLALRYLAERDVAAAYRGLLQKAEHALRLLRNQKN